MTATIKDVARIAGCSIKTVSRVINDEPYVTEDLRTRVKAAIRTVGYAPNLSARRLVQQKAYMICILMYPGFTQPASALLTRIMDISHEENYEILIQPYFPGNSRSRNMLVELINGHRVDGMVSTPPCDSDEFLTDLLVTYKVPLVQISPVEPREDIPYVAGSDREGAYKIAGHLISLGHRRIAFLSGPRNLRASLDRLEGWRSALTDHGIVPDPALIKPTEFTFDGGYTAVKLLWEREVKPTAIFAGSDEAAYGAIFALQELGVSIPGQVSVCGYDDLAMSKSIWPGLTTVHQPADEMVDQATRMLIRIVKGDLIEQLRVVFPADLVVRGSTSRAAE